MNKLYEEFDMKENPEIEQLSREFLMLENELTEYTDDNPIEFVESDSDVLKDLENDYKTARANLYNLINKGNKLLNLATNIAADGGRGSTMALQAAASILKNISDINKDIFEIHDRIKKLKEQEIEEKDTPTTVNNNLYVGTTEDLIKMIRDKK